MVYRCGHKLDEAHFKLARPDDGFLIAFYYLGLVSGTDVFCCWGLVYILVR